MGIKYWIYPILLASCYKGHLYVQQENVDGRSLASTYVHSPDPRSKHPPKGQRLLFSWDYPHSVYIRGITLVFTVRFWDNREETLIFPLQRKRGSSEFFFDDKENKILTYQVEAVTKDKEILETWKHQLWTDLITPEEE